MVTALMFKPGEHPEMVQLIDDDMYLDLAVSFGCELRCSATAVRVGEGVVALYADEGVTFGLIPNRRIGKRILAGTIYIVGEANGELRALVLEEIIKYGKRYWQPESYTEDETIDSWFDGLYLAT